MTVETMDEASAKGPATRLTPALRAMLWMAASGVAFTALNTLMKWLAHDMDPFQVGFLRYFFGFVVMVPVGLRIGLAACRTSSLGLHVVRNAFHSAGMLCWFFALPMATMADMTAIGFTGPIFICLGAVLFLGERMTGARWLAVLVGFAGVLTVVRPWEPGAMSGVGFGNVMLLCASPLFAGSFLLAKVLTRHERSDSIVLWQHGLVSLFCLPFAWVNWTAPTPLQWGLFVVCGILGAGGHYLLTRAFKAADISASQSVRFLDLIWAAIGGFMVFGSVPGVWTVAGAAIIFSSTLWLARHEAQARAMAK